jgi:transposase
MGWRRGQALSQDLRDRVLASEGSARVVARRFGVSVSYVVKARLRRRRLGTDTPGAQRSHAPRRLAEVHESIRAHVQLHPDATLNELRAWLQAVHGVLPSMGLMWNTLDRLGLTLKKGPARRRTGPRRYRRSAPPVARTAAPAEPGAARLHR